MKRIIAFFIGLLAFVASFSQSFEGKIVYQNAYKSKIPNVTDEQLTAAMGNTQEYFIKDGNYKSVCNGSLFQWMLFQQKDNKIYSKLSNSESILWNDAALNPNEVLKAEVNKGVVEVLGFKCDELVLTCKNGIEKYYFSSGFAVDPKLFVNHKYGNFYDFISRAKALPLKAIIENGQYVLESIATEAKPMKVADSIFLLPENAQLVKNPY